MSGLRILITNSALDRRAGTELYVRDLALGLLARGHTPVVYSPLLGDVAAELRAATVPVVNDLNALSLVPDVIHGHHHIETMTALLHFCAVPAVYVCHGWQPWLETPPRFLRIVRYVAVDHLCRDRLLLERGIPEDRTRVILNFVDLQRFKSRNPLPARPRRAVVFSNNASELTYLAEARKACANNNVQLDVIGFRANSTSTEPEARLGQYDLVFAKGRAAIEAMAVGAAVVLCDAAGAGPMVTARDLDQLRVLNFGRRTLRQPCRADVLEREIGRYDAEDAAEVSRRIRASAGRDAAIDEFVVLYREVVAEFMRAGTRDVEAEGRAAAAYLRELKADLAAGAEPTLRLRDHVQRVPIIRTFAGQIARAIVRKLS